MNSAHNNNNDSNNSNDNDNNQFSYIKMHGLSYYLYTAVPITAMLLLVLLPLLLLFFALRKLLIERMTLHWKKKKKKKKRKRNVNDGVDAVSTVMEMERTDDQRQWNGIPLSDRRNCDERSLVVSRWVLEVMFRVENLWFLLVCFALQGYVILAISMYSVHVQYYGLLAGMLFGMLFNLCAVAHIFRERVLVSRDALARLETEDESAAGSVVAIDSTDDHLIIDDSESLQSESSEEEISLNVNMRYRMSSPNAIQQFQRDAETLHSSDIMTENDASRRKRKMTISRVTLSYMERVSVGIKRHTCLFLLTLLASMLFTAMMYLSTFGMCVCLQPFQLSSSLLRSLSKRSCPPNEICFTYLNLAEDPSTEVIVKFHTYDKPADDFSAAYILFGTSAHDLNQRLNCTSADFSPYTMDFFHGNKYIHTCEMVNLLPDMEYHFRPVLETTVSAANLTRVIITTPPSDQPLKLKTLHRDSTRNVRFVNGGDLGATPAAFRMLDVAIQYDPDFIALGGDIAYDNGFTTCYRRWDHVLKHYSKHAISKSGALIPLLTCIGNHEAEWNQFSMMPWNARAYLHFFTHKIGIQRGDIATSNEGAYHAHHLADHTLLLALDSGIITPHGAQNEFIQTQLTGTTAKNKIAMYHAPLYPSSRKFNAAPSARGREMWEPLFNTHGVQVGLEHHDHAFKRTKQLLAGKEVHSGGTVYLGDGLMGVGERSVAFGSAQRDYLAKAEGTRHVWLVECSVHGASFSAIDERGNVIDAFVTS